MLFFFFAGTLVHSLLNWLVAGAFRVRWSGQNWGWGVIESGGNEKEKCPRA